MPDTTVPNATGAEAEAAGLAAAALAGRQLWVPRVVLPDGHVARFDGAAGIAPATLSSAGPGLTPATSPVAVPAEQQFDLAAASIRLDKLVAQNHQAELKRMSNELGGFWELARAKREVVLALLDPHPFVVARALVRKLKPEERRFLALVDDAQHRDHPRSAIAVLAALDSGDIRALDYRLTQGWGAPLHGVDTTRLDQAALRGLYAVLRGQSDEALRRLCGGDRRDFFRELLDTPVPWGDESADIKSALAEEDRTDLARRYSLSGKKDDPGVDLDLISHIRELLRRRNAEQARKALSALTPLAEAIEEESSLPPGAADRPKPPENAPVQPNERMRVVVTELDRYGLVDAILDHLPEEDRYRTGVDPSQRYGTVLAAMLANRAPGLTLGRIESLLSRDIHHFFVITDSDARFAYFLVRTLPLAEQDRWRLRDDSKWFHRLEDNLPDGMVESGEYTGVGNEYLPAGQPEGTQSVVLSLLKWALDTWKDSPDQDTAKVLIHRLAPPEAELAGTGGSSPAPAIPAAAARSAVAGAATGDADRNTRIAVVRRLDTLGVIDDLLDELPRDDLVSEDVRHGVDRLAAMRDPVRLEEQATKLLSTNLIDWWISAREAWLAHLLLRALPPAEQKRWDREHPGKWSAMMQAVTSELRSADAMGALTGRNGFPTLADLHERLRDPTLWDGKHNPQLRSLIIMAYAADDRHSVFDLSRRYADFLPKIGPVLVADLDLYDPAANRLSYHDRDLHIPGFFEEVLTAAGTEGKFVLYLVGVGLELLWAARRRTINMNLDLQATQWALGGDVFGAELTDRQRTIVGGTTKQERELRDHTNLLEVHMDPGSGAFRLALPKLRLSHLNISRPGASYRTGQVELTGLQVHGTFSDRHYRQPIGFDFSMTDADVRDVVIANEAFGAVALAQLLLSMLRLRAGATGAEDLAAHPPRPGTVGFPIFGLLLQAIDNLVMLLGGLPFPLDYSVVDLILWPLDFGLKNWLIEHGAEAAVSNVANKVVRSPHPAGYVYGLVSDGTLRPPRSVTDRLTDAARMLRSAAISFTDLEISGLSLGAAVQIGSIRLHDVTAGGARSLPGHLRLLIQSLNHRIPALTGPQRDAAVAQRDAALEQLDRLTVSELRIRDLREREKAKTITPAERAELSALVKAQDEVVEQRRRARLALPAEAVEDPARLLPPTEAEVLQEKLERKDRWIAGSLKPAERAELARLNTLLRSDIGAAVDIGGIDVGEVSGAVEAAGAKVGPIHLDARVPDTLLPSISGSYLADPELIARFRAGGRRTPTAADLGKSAQVNLSVAGIELQPDPDGGAVLRLPPGRLPSYAELQERLAALPANVHQALRDRLTLARDVARRMEELQREAGKDVQVRQLREGLRRLMSVEIGELTVGPVTGGLDPATGNLTAKIAGVDAKDIVGPQVLIDRATGSVEVGAALTSIPGAAGAKDSWADFAKSLHPRVGVDLSLENVRTTTGSADRIVITGLRGTVEMLRDGVRIADLAAESIEVGGLDLGTPEVSITGSNVRLDGLTGDVTFRMTAEGDVRTTELQVADLRIGQITGDHLVYAKTEGTTQLRAEVSHGVLGDIRASDIRYRQGAMGRPEFDVHATVGTADVQYEVVRELLSGAGRTTVAGTVAGGPGTLAGPGAAPVAAPALTVSFAQDAGHRTLSLDAPGLLAAGTQISTPDGSLTIRRLGVQAHAKLTEDEQGRTAVSGTADLNNIEIGPVNWHSGTTRLVSAGGSKLAAVHIEATYHGAQPAKDGAAATPATLEVDRFDIDGIDVADLHYTDSGGSSPIDVRLGSAHSHPGALRIEQIKLHDFNLPFTDQGLDLPHAGVKADITGFHLDARMIYGRIRGSGEINARIISVGLGQGGRKITTGAKGVAAGVEISYADPGEPPRFGRKASDPLFDMGHLTIYDSDTGDITITPDAIEVAGLHVPEMDVTSLYVTWGATGYMRATGRRPKGGVPGSSGGTASTPTTSGAVYVNDVDVDARIDRASGKIALRRMTIDHIDAEGIVAEIPGLGTFGVPAPVAGKPLPPLTRLAHIRLGGSTAHGFVISPNRAGLVAAGTVHVDEATIPRLSADVKGMFKGDVALSTDAIEMDLPASGGVDVSIIKPHAKVLGRAELDATTTTLELGAIDADTLHYASAGVELSHTTLSGIEYDDAVGGISVKVRSAKLPGTATLARSGKIPELDITDADLHVDFTAQPPTARPVMKPAPVVLGEMLMDHFEGDIPLSVVLQSVPIPHLGLHDIDVDIDLKFVRGTLDFKDLRSQMVRTITFHPPHFALSAGAHLVDFVSVGNDVHLRLSVTIPIPVSGGIFIPYTYTKDFLTWHLKKPSDVTLFKTSEQMRLATVVNDLDLSGGGGGGPGGISVTLGAKSRLGITNPTPIDIDLLTGNPTGRVTLAPDVAIGFGAKGTVFPMKLPGTLGTGSLTDITLDKFEVQKTDLTLRGGGVVKTGTIRIEKVHDGSLMMDEITPKVLDLSITRAVARDIEWTLPVLGAAR